VIPANGAMAEQFSKKDGSPASAKELTWSYGSLLTAILEREKLHRSSVDFSRLKFACPIKAKQGLSGEIETNIDSETAPAK
ncbi:MAG: glycoside hydrolase family 15 protein, partial [Bdellovibrionota bacterium]